VLRKGKNDLFRLSFRPTRHTTHTQDTPLITHDHFGLRSHGRKALDTKLGMEDIQNFEKMYFVPPSKSKALLSHGIEFSLVGCSVFHKEPNLKAFSKFLID
jgi:hypothetical protein